MPPPMWKEWIRQPYGYARAVAKLSKTLVQGAPPILIYQMGSAGSTSIRNSLRRSYPGLIHRTHGFGPETASPIGQLLYRTCIDGEMPIRIISIVRDPIAQNISHFFRFYPNWVGKNPERWPEDTDILEEGEALTTEFMDCFPHDRLLKWFDSYERDIGVNIYKEKFDSKKGYELIGKKNKKLLVMRIEKNDEYKQKILKEFLNLDIFSISRENEADKKTYSDSYRQFLINFTPPDWYLEKMYSSRYFEHFYGQDMRKEFVKKWRE